MSKTYRDIDPKARERDKFIRRRPKRQLQEEPEEDWREIALRDEAEDDQPNR